MLCSSETYFDLLLWFRDRLFQIRGSQFRSFSLPPSFVYHLLTTITYLSLIVTTSVRSFKTWDIGDIINRPYFFQYREIISLVCFLFAITSHLSPPLLNPFGYLSLLSSAVCPGNPQLFAAFVDLTSSFHFPIHHPQYGQQLLQTETLRRASILSFIFKKRYADLR